MLRNFLKNKKAQNTAEYALLIALVVAGIIAMQTYAQRALQARIHDAAQYMATTAGNGVIGNSTQYEPYYLNTQYTVNTQSDDNTRQGLGTFAYDSTTNRSRLGNQLDSYNTADMQQTL
jgi:Flp pilus assembly pilin Flp